MGSIPDNIACMARGQTYKRFKIQDMSQGLVKNHRKFSVLPHCLLYAHSLNLIGFYSYSF